MATPTTDTHQLGPSLAADQAPSDDFVGRREALQVLGEMLADGGAVVVCGPPGVGKSRLVRRFVDTRQRRGAAIDWISVDLSQTLAIRGCRECLAGALDLDESAPLAAVGRALAGRDAAGLILDGAEALYGDSSWLTTLRQAAPDTPVLVTSQKRLGSPMFTQLYLGGLDDDQAVELFHRHLRSAAGEVDGTVVDALVSRLDGLPLPVKLAARRTNLMSPAMLLERLDRRLEVFGSHDGESFERSLQHSWDRLSEAEQAFLEQCSTFVSSFTLEAAEHVVEVEADAPTGGAIELVSRLLDASWLRESVDSVGPQTRFDSWEALRVFAARKLQETSGAERVYERYVDYYRRRAASLVAKVESPDGLDAIERMRMERAHLLAVVDGCALDGSLAERGPRLAAEILWALRWLVRLEDDPDQMLRRLERVSDALHGADDAKWRACMAVLRGELELRRGQSDMASERLEGAYEAVKSTDDIDLEARVARASSMALAHVDIEAAEQRLRGALELTNQTRDRLLEGRIRERLGFVQLQSFQLQEARQSFRRARRLLSSHGNALMAAEATNGLAYVALRTGHRTGAASAFEETVQMFARIRDRRREAEGRFNFGVALHAEGDLGDARQQFEYSLELWGQFGEGRYETIARSRLGLVYAELGSMDAAFREIKTAVAASQRCGDWHNRAIAEASRVMLEHLSGQTGRIVDLEQALEQMQFAVDPDAAAAALCVLAVLRAIRCQPEAASTAIQRLSAIQSLLAPQDVYLRRVIDSLSKLAYQWVSEALADHDVAFGSAGLDEPGADQLLAYVPSLFDEQSAALRQARGLFNPYLRLLFCGYIDLNDPGDTSSIMLIDRPLDQARAAVVVHRLGHWFEVDDESPTNLLSRQPLRRLLEAIVTSHLEEADPGQSVDQLIEAGWPDDVLTRSAGANRVYTAIRSLRDMGLETILITGPNGYCLADDVAVELTDDPIESR